jgi:polyisoprenyl-teichoic acid--peptidoglycan teichoic acid transferase
LLTLIVPGSAQLVAGNRKFARIAIIATLSFWAIALITILVGLVDKNGLLFRVIPVNFVFGFLALVLTVYGILFAVLAVDTLRLMRLGRLYKRERWIAFGGLVLAAVIGTSGLSWAGSTAGVSAGALGSIFNQSGFTTPVDGRYNIMLLGADSGRDRFGIRPDSISVISINAATGQAVNVGLPRNLQHVGFVAGSPMLKVYPNGWNCGFECLINAIYKDVTDNHSDLYPDAVKHGSTPGVEATRDAVEYVTGLKIQSYVIVDMAAFSSLIDALGGIDINVQQRLPIGGQKDDLSDVKGWIEAGQQHMNGYTALWYARSRHSTNDYDRMRRQHEVEDQVLKQMDPANVLSRVQQIMSAGKQLVRTDIPSGMLFEYKNLAGKAKSFGIKSLNITPPNYDPVYPNFSKIHADIKAKFDAESKN